MPFLPPIRDFILTRLSRSYAAFLHNKESYLTFQKFEGLAQKVVDLATEVSALNESLTESARQRHIAETALAATRSRISELSGQVQSLEAQLKSRSDQEDLKKVLNWVTQGAWGRPVFGELVPPDQTPPPPSDPTRLTSITSGRRSQMKDLAAALQERISASLAPIPATMPQDARDDR